MKNCDGIWGMVWAPILDILLSGGIGLVIGDMFNRPALGCLLGFTVSFGFFTIAFIISLLDVTTPK